MEPPSQQELSPAGVPLVVVKEDGSRFGPNSLVLGNDCVGTGPGCVLRGHRGRIENADHSYIHGDDWVAYCKTVSSVVNRGANNIIACSRAGRSRPAKKKAPTRRDRERDRSTGPPPLPRDHRCHVAEEGDLECLICAENRVDALLRPCNHAMMCVDCAANVYRASRLCPTCRAPIKSVIPVVFSGVKA